MTLIDTNGGSDGGHGTALETPPAGVPRLQSVSTPSAAAPTLTSGAASEMASGMRVKKRNGTLEPVDVNKIVNAVAKSAEGLRGVDPMRVATRTISALADGATTRELDELSIRTAAGLSSRSRPTPSSPPGCCRR